MDNGEKAILAGGVVFLIVWVIAVLASLVLPVLLVIYLVNHL